MKYVKVFPSLAMNEAEATLNAFYRELNEAGHRVLASSFKMNGDTLSAIYTITDQINH